MSPDLAVSVSVNFRWLSGPQFSLDGVVGRPVRVLVPGFEIRHMSSLQIRESYYQET
jgi:hypothetical protein